MSLDISLNISKLGLTEIFTVVTSIFNILFFVDPNPNEYNSNIHVNICITFEIFDTKFANTKINLTYKKKD